MRLAAARAQEQKLATTFRFHIPQYLKRRAAEDSAGMTEDGFLNPLRELVDRGYTRAEELLGRFHGEWKGDLAPLFKEYNFL